VILSKVYKEYNK